MEDMSEELPRFEIKPSNESTLALEVFKTGLLTGKRHIFFFEKYTGEVLYDSASPEKSNAHLTIDAGSVTLQDKWLKPKQKVHILEVARNDMLAAARHPQITFTSSGAIKKSSSLYLVRGELTIRGVTRPVEIEVAVKPLGDRRLELDGNAFVRMKEYGLKPPSALLGLIGTKDRMELRFLVWAEHALP